MLTKWKLYRILVYYLFLFTIPWCARAIYLLFDDPEKLEDLGIIALVFAVTAVLAIKSYYSIKALNHYKKGTLLRLTEKRIFITGFILLTIGALIGLAEIWLTLVPTIRRIVIAAGRGYYSNYSEAILGVFLTASLIMAIICAAYTSIFDLILLRAIRKKHYAILEDIGKNSVETN